LAAYLEEGFSKQKLEAELWNENSQFYFAHQGDEAQRDVLMKLDL
jgi:hypothetical protein